MNKHIHTEKDLKDPVCNMTVSSDSELHYHHADRDYYFCSSHCLHRFTENPSLYMEEKKPPLPEIGHKSGSYTCPMHPEVKQGNPGNCPKCGMALVSAGIPEALTKTEYNLPHAS